MPPDVYSRMSEQSKIKATAVVEEVKTLEITRQSTWKFCSFFVETSDVERSAGEVFRNMLFGGS